MQNPVGPEPSKKLRTGPLGENLAAIYLQLQGYHILEQNYRVGHLEVDLLAKKGSTLIVVEVKLRRSSYWGKPLAHISEKKKRDLETAGLTYWKRRRGREKAIRFDVIGIELGLGSLVLTHIDRAFSGTGRYR